MYASVGEPFLFSAEREYVKMLTGLVSRGAAACAYAVLMMVASGIAAAPSPPAPCVLIPSIQDLPKTYPCTSAPTFSSSPLTIAFVWPGVERSTCAASSPSIAFLKTVGIDRPPGLDPRAHAHAHARTPARAHCRQGAITSFAVLISRCQRTRTPLTAITTRWRT